MCSVKLSSSSSCLSVFSIETGWCLYELLTCQLFMNPHICLFSFNMLLNVCVFIFRGRRVMWLRAVTLPETRPKLHSSHMWMKTNWRVLRHMNVSMSQAYKGFLYCVYLEQQRLNSLMRLRLFIQISSACWTTMRCLQVCQRRSPQKSSKRTSSLSMPSWRQMSWRYSGFIGGHELRNHLSCCLLIG